jgi:hypothetical protein
MEADGGGNSVTDREGANEGCDRIAEEADGRAGGDCGQGDGAKAFQAFEKTNSWAG